MVDAYSHDDRIGIGEQRSSHVAEAAIFRRCIRGGDDQRVRPCANGTTDLSGIEDIGHVIDHHPTLIVTGISRRRGNRRRNYGGWGWKHQGLSRSMALVVSMVAKQVE